MTAADYFGPDPYEERPDYFGPLPATREEMAAALARAGITPEEFNGPDPRPEPPWGLLKPRSRWWFRREDDGTLSAGRDS